MLKEAFTVSKMLDSINATMEHVGGRVQLKRDVGNGVALDTTEKEIAYLDTQSKIKASAERAAVLTPEGKLEWIASYRSKGNDLFHAGAFAQASDAYLEALAGLDFSTDKHHMQVTVQNPLTCNLVACMLKLEQWSKAVKMCDLVLSSEPCNLKSLRQRAKALVQLERFEDARTDLRTALACVADGGAEAAALTRQLASIDRAEIGCKRQRLSQRVFQKNMMKRMGSLYDDKKTVVASPTAAPPSTLSTVLRLVRQLFHICFRKRKAR
ncbi:hypothetical protein ACHHYP_14325 [Achlya hypogyna]|uniref:Uncharacterized protein n=1 Tax=Achlya hypogyna TaxID=1202772 RepID=A0A1V9YDF5_ACHHY|nr:hypothetical protein ACHHYP_14325 [Achlya hypogyna]